MVRSAQRIAWPTAVGHDACVTRETNWGGNHAYRATDVTRPSSLDDLRKIVQSSEQVAAIATRHSFNAIGDAATIIDVSDIESSVVFDSDTSTVCVSPSSTYAQLASQLDVAGRALHNLASLPHISVGGAISTGTHGSGSRLGNLSTAVRELDVVVASGDLITYRHGEPDFDGVVVGLGALGVVTRVVLQTEPTYDVIQSVYDGLEWGMLIDRFDAVFGAATSVSVFTRWGDVVGELWCKQRDDMPTSGHFDPRSLRAAGGMRHPIPGAAADGCTEQFGKPGPWSERLPHFRADSMPSTGNEIQAEFFVDRADSGLAIEAMRSIAGQLDDVLLVSEIRTVAADRLWMSAHHGRHSTGFHFTFRMDPAGVQRAVDEIAAAVSDLNPRFHPSKGLPTGWRFGLPEQDRFLELKQCLDPHDRFTTPWFRTHVEDTLR